MKIPFSPPDLSQKEIELVNEVLKSGWITTGPRTKELERKIAEYIGVDKAVCLNSATACMELTLRILGVGEGDEVILPAYTYTATASVVEHVGASIVMIDCDEESFEMDYKALEQAISPRTKVVMPVDLAGRLCDYEKIYTIIEKKKTIFAPNNEIQKAFGRIVVLADSAHGFGAEVNGKKSGEIADFTSFSFHAVKNLTTVEGGAIVWKNIDGIDNDWLYNEYMLASLHGQTKDALSKTKLGSWEYDIKYPAYKCNMTDINAAIGLGQLERYDELIQKRRQIVHTYDKAFKELGFKPLVHFDKNNNSSCHLYLLRIPNINEEKRNKIIELLAQKGIATNVHYKPLPLLTAYKDLGFNINEFPNAYRMYENEISLPLHTKLSDDEVNYIIENVIGVVKESLK